MPASWVSQKASKNINCRSCYGRDDKFLFEMRPGPAEMQCDIACRREYNKGEC